MLFCPVVEASPFDYARRALAPLREELLAVILSGSNTIYKRDFLWVDCRLEP
jgi:hypothetical protein